MSAVQRVYQALEMNWSNFLITAVVCAASPGVTWLLVERSGLGFLGAAWGASCCSVLYLLLQLPHLCMLGRVDLFVPRPLSLLLSRQAAREHLRLMAPGFLMTVAEW